MTKKNISLVLTLLVAALLFAYEQGLIPDGGVSNATVETQDSSDIRSNDRIAAAYRDGRSDVQVRGIGVVKKVLRDDLKGSRHQRFLLRLDNGQTLLVAHNIDLAPRIPGLQKGDSVEFYGEYEWNNKGGVVHWTHHDPGGRHADGWLRHRGRTYQ